MVLALPLLVGCPQGSVTHPDRRELKQRLFRALFLTQAGGGGGREGVGGWGGGGDTLGIIGMRGKPEAAEVATA